MYIDEGGGGGYTECTRYGCALIGCVLCLRCRHGQRVSRGLLGRAVRVLQVLWWSVVLVMVLVSGVGDVGWWVVDGKGGMEREQET
jgi:hypothetical protein